MLSGELLMSGQTIKDLGQPSDPSDAVPKNFLESSLNNYVLKSSKISYNKLTAALKDIIQSPLIVKIVGSPASHVVTTGETSS